MLWIPLWKRLDTRTCGEQKCFDVLSRLNKDEKEPRLQCVSVKLHLDNKIFTCEKFRWKKTHDRAQWRSCVCLHTDFHASALIN